MPVDGPEVELRFPHVPSGFSRLRGTISLPDTRPARDWPLALLHPDGPQPIRSARTDVDGKFEMPRLPPGDYTLVLNGSAEVFDGTLPAKLRGGRTLTVQATLNLRLPGPRHRARAVCSDEIGVLLEGVMVHFSGVNLNAPPVRSGPDGAAVAEGRPVPALAATGNVEGRFPRVGPVVPGGPGDVPEVQLTLPTVDTLRVEILDAGTAEPIPRYDVHVHHEVGMAGDECGTVPRGIRGKGVMKRGKLIVVAGPATVQAEAPGYEGASLETIIPPGGPSEPARIRLRARAT